MLNVVHSTALARGGVPSENGKRLWSAEIETPSPCISLWFLYWCKTWSLPTFYGIVTVVTDLPVDDAVYRPMFWMKVVVMLSTVHEGWDGSCVYRLYSRVSWRWSEVKFHQQIPQLLRCSEGEECYAFVPTYEQALKRAVCITLTQLPSPVPWPLKNALPVVFQDEIGKHVFGYSCLQSVRN